MRFTVTYGRTVQPAEYESIHQEHTQDFDTDDVSWEEAYATVRSFVLGKLEADLASSGFKGVMPWVSPEEHGVAVARAKTPETPQAIASKPSFEGLPWVTFRSKEPCQPGEAGWTFRNVYDSDRTVPGAEALVAQLDPEGKKWTRIGEMEYRLSGEGLALIQRRPVKKEARRY